MRKTRSFWMRILVLILILSIMPFSALADGYVIENISAESYVDEFGQMVESFTVRFAEGTDLTGITKANVFVENNYTPTRRNSPMASSASSFMETPWSLM